MGESVFITYFIILLLSFIGGISARVYNTTDSVVLEGDYLPRLPGPSIFEYRNEFIYGPSPTPPTQETSESSSIESTVLSGDSSKVKRGNENETKSEQSSTERPRYYEMAGDELYVFEPSPMGAQPFMDAFIPHETENTEPDHHFHKPQFKKHNKNRQKLHNPNFFIKENSRPHQHPRNPIVQQNLFRPPFNFGLDSKIEQTSDTDVGHPSECISANEKEGECVPFRSCYPVVFNTVDGQLKNHGLAKMLYQASGPCAKLDKTVSVQVQPGVTSHVPLDFFNYTVCCPGYFYFENTIPHHYEPTKKPLKLKLRPSHPDLMLSPQEGRTMHGPHLHHHGFRHNQQYYTLPPPPPILLHHHDMFDSDVMQEDDGNYYQDEFEDFDHLATTTSSTTTTPKPRERHRSKNKLSASPKNSTTKLQSSSSKNVTKLENSQKRAESTRTEVKVGVEETSKDVKTKVKHSSNTGRKNNTENHYNKNHEKPEHKILANSPATAAGPVIIPPPHLSAWNCPGRQQNTPRGYWPWMVALLNEGSHFCTGSLIDHRHILTSASCVASFKGKDIGKIRAILGDRILYSSVDGPHVWRKILRITRHLQYNSDSMEHDIAILEMDNVINYTPNIQPINLPSSSNKGHTYKGIISGWSGSDLGKRFFNPRSTVDSIVEFMGREECSKKYDGFKSNRVLEDVICTKPSESSCKADLGSPLMMKTGNCFHIIGILSHGLGCGMFPDIFTDTAKHIPWIQKNIRPKFPTHDTFLKP